MATYDYFKDSSWTVGQGRYSALEYHDIWYRGSHTPYSHSRPDTDFVRLRQIRKNLDEGLQEYVDGAVYSPYVSGDAVPIFWVRPDAASISDSIQNRALSSFISKVHGRDNANIPLALADMRQTSSMLASRGFQIAAVLNALRRGKIAKAFKLLDVDNPKLRRKLVKKERNYRRQGLSPSKKVASHWLELQFGILPLISDISNLVGIIEDQIHSKPDLVVARSSYGETIETTSGVKCTSYLTPGSAPYMYGSTELRHSYSGRYTITDPNVLLLKSLGLTNPFFIAYDLIPLSFVAGWVLNISAYLKQYDFDHGLTAKNLSHSYLLKERGGGTRWKSGYWCLRGIHEVDYFQRTAYPELNLNLSANLSGLLDLWKSTTALALISQRSK